MGTRSKTRDTRKKGGVWTKNKRNTVRRRENLIAFASNSKTKSNAARNAVRQYLMNAEQEEKIENMTITFDMALEAIGPNKKPATLTDYVGFAKQRYVSLIEGTIVKMMRQKKQINEERRRSKQFTFLANRAAARAQQAAYIASLGRLLNSPHDNAIQQELKKWNESALQRELNQQREVEEAKHIFKNETTIQLEETRLRYELTKQLVQHIEKLDYILVLHYEIQEKALGMMSVWYKTKEKDENTLVERARAKILKQIPTLGGMVSVDRALPYVLEDVMKLLVEASDAYMKTLHGTPLEMAKARLEHTRIQEKQLRYAKVHFDILIKYDPSLRQELAKNLDAPKYQAILKQLEKDIQEVEKLEKK